MRRFASVARPSLLEESAEDDADEADELRDKDEERERDEELSLCL